VPYFSTQEMADRIELEHIADLIETTLCQVWANDPENVNDRTAARLVELMMDKYHFNDTEPRMDTPVRAEGYAMLSRNISRELSHIAPEVLVKVLAAVYRSIQRRSIGGSSYLQFVSNFTGVEPGG